MQNKLEKVDVRCPKCNKLICKISKENRNVTLEIKCPKCKEIFNVIY